VTYGIYAGELGQPKRGDVLPDGSIAGGNNIGQASDWRWRSLAALDWSRGAWDASVTARYFSSLLENCEAVIDTADTVGDPSLYKLCNRPDRSIDDYPANQMASVTYFDLSAGWEASWRGRFEVGVRNAFDRDPPPSRSEVNGDITFIPDYDIPGRYWYASYRQKF
jgi:iron complex outermembrane receptor protein